MIHLMAGEIADLYRKLLAVSELDPDLCDRSQVGEFDTGAKLLCTECGMDVPESVDLTVRNCWEDGTETQVCRECLTLALGLTAGKT